MATNWTGSGVIPTRKTLIPQRPITEPKKAVKPNPNTHSVVVGETPSLPFAPKLFPGTAYVVEDPAFRLRQAMIAKGLIIPVENKQVRHFA